MYYVSSKNPLSAVPDVSGLGRFNLLSRVSGDNGITSLAVPAELITTRLNTNYFTVNNSVGIRLLRETTVDNQLTVNSDIIGNAGFTLGGSTTIGGSVAAAGNITSNGVIYSNGPTHPLGRNSDDWYQAYTTVSSSSGSWSYAYTALANALPFAWPTRTLKSAATIS